MSAKLIPFMGKVNVNHRGGTLKTKTLKDGSVLRLIQVEDLAEKNRLRLHLSENKNDPNAMIFGGEYADEIKEPECRVFFGAIRSRQEFIQLSLEREKAIKALFKESREKLSVM